MPRCNKEHIIHSPWKTQSGTENYWASASLTVAVSCLGCQHGMHSGVPRLTFCWVDRSPVPSGKEADGFLI